MSNEFIESRSNMVAESTEIEGKVVFQNTTRFHGKIRGEVRCGSGSTLLLAETAFIDGDIYAEEIWIDGYVRGNVVATSRVIITGKGRVVGSIETPSLQVEFGAYFEGVTRMEKSGRPKASGVLPSTLT
jgi:cytoskeletal protein CcmA (bactofilin family)